MLRQIFLNFSDFNTVSTYFHLKVLATNVFQPAVGQTNKISRTIIHLAGLRMHWVHDERFLRLLRLIQITPSKTHRMNQELPCYILRTRLVIPIYDEHFIVMDWLAYTYGRQILR
ncbi:hypothetical protein D3C74_275910 [compost metagenome]